MSVIDLLRLDDAGFDALFDARIAPLFAETEAERAEAAKLHRSRLSWGLPLAGVVAAGVGLVSGSLFFGFFAGFVMCVGVFGYAQAPMRALGRRLKHGALSQLAQAIGARYGGDDVPADLLERQLRLGLLPNHDRRALEDGFYGERWGCAFSLCEAHLEQERRSNKSTTWVTVFRGQLIRIAFPKPFAGVTLVRRDAGIFNGVAGWGSKLQRVGFADPAFERAFEVYSSDQVEARYLLHPVFAERLLELEARFDGKRLRCGFEGGDLLIAVEGKDRFEIGDLFDARADKERVRAIVEDIGAILAVTDAVLTAERAPLAGRTGPTGQTPH